MKVIKPSYKILTEISEGGIEELKQIERIGRVCYKSEDKITEDGESAKKFVAMLIKKGHEAMIEHSTLSVKFVIDRGSTHDLVRHRIASFAQESTRYCNYTKDKFDGELTFIDPGYLRNNFYNYSKWLDVMEKVEDNYRLLIENGVTPSEARSILPNSLKAEIIITANYREWRNILKLRTAADVHYHILEVMVPLLFDLKSRIPVIFDNIWVPMSNTKFFPCCSKGDE